MIGPRIVGVDVGKKRVGIAISDPLRLFAQPYGTYDPDTSLRILKEISGTSGIETIVVGWPLTEAGEEGAATQMVSAYLGRLKVELPDAPVDTWDERFSSQEAREQILVAGARKKARRNKERVDAAAAAVILQQYLDR